MSDGRRTSQETFFFIIATKQCLVIFSSDSLKSCEIATQLIEMSNLTYHVAIDFMANIFHLSPSIFFIRKSIDIASLFIGILISSSMRLRWIGTYFAFILDFMYTNNDNNEEKKNDKWENVQDKGTIHSHYVLTDIQKFDEWSMSFRRLLAILNKQIFNMSINYG